MQTDFQFLFLVYLSTDRNDQLSIFIVLCSKALQRKKKTTKIILSLYCWLLVALLSIVIKGLWNLQDVQLIKFISKLTLLMLHRTSYIFKLLLINPKWLVYFEKLTQILHYSTVCPLFSTAWGILSQNLANNVCLSVSPSIFCWHLLFKIIEISFTYRDKKPMFFFLCSLNEDAEIYFNCLEK